MPKKTEELLNILKENDSFKKYLEENREEMYTGNLPELLSELVEKNGMKRIDAIVEAGLSEVYGYQIFSGMRRPERGKLLRLAIALRADLDDIQMLLKKAGYPPLYARLPADCVMIYGIVHGMTLAQIDGLLFEYEQNPL